MAKPKQQPAKKSPPVKREAPVDEEPPVKPDLPTPGSKRLPDLPDEGLVA